MHESWYFFKTPNDNVAYGRPEENVIITGIMLTEAKEQGGVSEDFRVLTVVFREFRLRVVSGDLKGLLWSH